MGADNSLPESPSQTFQEVFCVYASWGANYAKTYRLGKTQAAGIARPMAAVDRLNKEPVCEVGGDEGSGDRLVVGHMQSASPSITKVMSDRIVKGDKQAPKSA